MKNTSVFLRVLRGEFLYCLLPAVLSCLLVGCGDGRPKRVPVAGQVMIDGQPLTSGFIRLAPDDARAAHGRIDAEGRFRLSTFTPGDGCVLGTHRVIVISYDEHRPSEIRYLVPKHYFEPSTSGVTATIDGPTDSLQINLTWDGEEPAIVPYHAAGDADPALW